MRNFSSFIGFVPVRLFLLLKRGVGFIKTGTSMASVVNTRVKKYRKAIKANCNMCVNNSRKGCRFGWEPIKGKCTRFGTNHYKLSSDEIKKSKEISKRNKEEILKGKAESEKINLTTIQKINERLETKLTIEILREAKKFKSFGNGRFDIKYIGSDDEDIICIKFRDKRLRKFKII